MIRDIQQKLMRRLVEHVPSGKSVWGVYAIIVFLVYSWTLIASFYKLPSWMFFLTINQILSIYAYSFSVNFLESVFLLTGILLLEFTLFIGLRNKAEFQPRAVLVALFFLASIMVRLYLFQGYEEVDDFIAGESTWWTIIIPFCLFFSVLGAKIKWLGKLLTSFSDQAVVFLYIYIPLSLFSLIAVLLRNIELVN